MRGTKAGQSPSQVGLTCCEPPAEADETALKRLLRRGRRTKTQKIPPMTSVKFKKLFSRSIIYLLVYLRRGRLINLAVDAPEWAKRLFFIRIQLANVTKSP